MSSQEIPVEHFAQLFHYYHQALANDSEDPAAVPTSGAGVDMPSSEKNRVIAAARLALLDLTPAERPSRPYFAKPGEAEWGC